MKKIIFMLTAILLFIPSGYSAGDNGLPPLMFPNIQEANKYVFENINNDIDYAVMLQNLHEQFFLTGDSTLMGYNWYSGVILADLDKDGIYELYLNASTGSGIIHGFLHGYNPESKKYYILSERMKTDYLFFLYEENLYVISSGPFFNAGVRGIYKPALVNDEFKLEEINETLQNEILGSIDSQNIFRPFDFELMRYNNLYQKH
jgi:uncharacterized LabA/DUF88 family protein